MAITMKIPKLIPALNISPTTLHELIIIDMKTKAIEVKNFDRNRDLLSMG